MAEPNKLKIPGESTLNPSFASPNVQTAADVATSQKVAGKAEGPATPPTPNGVPNQNSTVIPPGVPGTQNATAPTAPKASATVSSVPSAAATVPTSSGAPPGVPLTTPPPPTVGEAPTLKSTQGKNAAEDEWLQAQNENAMKLYEAALAYNGGPTSALAASQRAAEQGLRSSTANRGAAGTIESSLYGDDKTLISRNQALANTKAYNTYQEATNAANAALTKAQIAYARATEQEKREIAEAAERREQTEAMQRAAAASQASAAPAPGGGVVPYEHSTPGGGFVRVGMPPKPQRPGRGL